MTIAALVAELESLGVVLEADTAQRLVCRAPAGVLSEGYRAALAVNKDRVVDFLAARLRGVGDSVTPEVQSPAGIEDPRPDLSADAVLWVALLRDAYALDGADPSGLFSCLHGLRCCGAKLDRTENGLTLSPRLAPEGIWERARDWRADITTFLFPNSVAARRLGILFDPIRVCPACCTARRSRLDGELAVKAVITWHRSHHPRLGLPDGLEADLVSVLEDDASLAERVMALVPHTGSVLASAGKRGGGFKTTETQGTPAPESISSFQQRGVLAGETPETQANPGAHSDSKPVVSVVSGVSNPPPAPPDAQGEIKGDVPDSASNQLPRGTGAGQVIKEALDAFGGLGNQLPSPPSIDGQLINAGADGRPEEEF